MLVIDRTRFWLAIFCRVVLGLYFGAAGAAIISGIRPPAAQAWVPLHGAGVRPMVYAVTLVVLSLALFVGYKARSVATASAAILYVILLDRVSADPLHNTMNHLLPLLVLALTILWCTEDAARTWTARRLTVLFCRLILGTIFFFQGLRPFTGAGVADFARRVYVQPLSDSWVPEQLLWLAGTANPFVQVSTGALLLIGVWTRAASFVVLSFLLSIFFGHLLANPFDPGAGAHAYAGANFAMAAVVYGLGEPRWRAQMRDAAATETPRGLSLPPD